MFFVLYYFLNAVVAQLVESQISNLIVMGSSPIHCFISVSPAVNSILNNNVPFYRILVVNLREMVYKLCV